MTLSLILSPNGFGWDGCGGRDLKRTSRHITCSGAIAPVRCVRLRRSDSRFASASQPAPTAHTLSRYAIGLHLADGFASSPLAPASVFCGGLLLWRVALPPPYSRKPRAAEGSG